MLAESCRCNTTLFHRVLATVERRLARFLPETIIAFRRFKRRVAFNEIIQPLFCRDFLVSDGLCPLRSIWQNEHSLICLTIQN